MGFVVFIIYLFCAYIRPYEFYPALQPIHIMQIVGGLGILLTIAYIPMSPSSFRSKQLFYMLLFSGIVLISRVIALHWFGGAINALQEFGVTLAVFLIALINVSTISRLRRTLGVLAIISLVLVFQGVLAVHFGVFQNLLVMKQYVETPNGEMLNRFDRLRATGFLTDPNDLAESLILTLPFIALAWRKRHLMRNFWLVILPIGFLLYGIYLTHSRGALISLLVMIAVAVSWRMGRTAAGFITGIGFTGALLINFTGGRGLASSDASATNRLEAWSVGLQLLKSHPLSGVGYGQFTDFNILTAHNSAVLCFAELGFPGFVVWLTLLLICFAELRSLRRMEPKNALGSELKRHAAAIELAFYGFLTAAWFLSRTYVLTLYLLIALAAASAEIARKNGYRVVGLSGLKLASFSTVMSLGVVMAVYLTIKVAVR
jgi:O-antigen ligase